MVESVGGLVGLGCCFSLPVVASYAPGGGAFVGAEVERRQPKPRRALRGLRLPDALRPLNPSSVPTFGARPRRPS